VSLDVEALWEQEYEAVREYFGRRLGEHWQDAPDLASETFARVWAARERYREMDGVPARAWLYRIAHNLLVDYWQARRPIVRLDALIEPSCTFRLDELAQRVDVGTAVAALSPRQRAVIIARYWEGRQHAEMGHITTLHGSKKLQDRAFVNLRRLLEAA